MSVIRLPIADIRTSVAHTGIDRFPGFRGRDQQPFPIADDRPLIPGIERPACFEIVPTARAVRRGRHIAPCSPLFRRSCDRATAGDASSAWRMRTVLDFHQGRARSDLLFTMSDNTRTSRADPGRARNSCNLMDERARKRAEHEGRDMCNRSCAT